jgi:hypothetical protein
VAASAGPVQFLITAVTVALRDPVPLVSARAVLRRLFRMAEFPDVLARQTEVTEIVLQVLTKFPTSLDVQLAGSGVLFFLTKKRTVESISSPETNASASDTVALSHDLRQAVLAVLLSSLERFHEYSAELTRNCALMLRLNFDASTELLPHALQLCELMLTAALRQTNQSTRINALAFCGMSLASLDPVVKAQMGEQHMHLALSLLTSLMDNYPPGSTEGAQLLEVLWTFFWNITGTEK